MYLVCEEEGKYTLFKEKTALADYLGVCYRTVLRNLRGGVWQKKNFSVYELEPLPRKSARGGRKKGF